MVSNRLFDHFARRTALHVRHRAGQHTTDFVAMLASLRCDHLLAPRFSVFVLFAEPVKRKRVRWLPRPRPTPVRLQANRETEGKGVIGGDTGFAEDLDASPSAIDPVDLDERHPYRPECRRRQDFRVLRRRHNRPAAHRHHGWPGASSQVRVSASTSSFFLVSRMLGWDLLSDNVIAHIMPSLSRA
jgi:hypothetical protein